VQPDAGGHRGAAHDARGAGRRQVVPVDEHQDLAIALGQLRQRGVDLLRRVGRRLGLADVRARLGGQALDEPDVPVSAAPARGQHLAGDPEQPRDLVGRDRLQPAPGDQEGLRDDVVDVAGSGAPRGITPHYRPAAHVEILEARSAIRGRAGGGGAVLREGRCGGHLP
jgi:hypothetical protein